MDSYGVEDKKAAFSNDTTLGLRDAGDSVLRSARPPARLLPENKSGAREEERAGGSAARAS